MKTCNGCDFAVRCWVERSGYCYRDEEHIEQSDKTKEDVDTMETFMKSARLIGWIVSESKQEAITALEELLRDIKERDEGRINMHIRLVEKV